MEEEGREGRRETGGRERRERGQRGGEEGERVGENMNTEEGRWEWGRKGKMREEQEIGEGWKEYK